jgi:hypothetical protein
LIALQLWPARTGSRAILVFLNVLAKQVDHEKFVDILLGEDVVGFVFVEKIFDVGELDKVLVDVEVPDGPAIVSGEYVQFDEFAGVYGVDAGDLQMAKYFSDEVFANLFVGDEGAHGREK